MIFKLVFLLTVVSCASGLNLECSTDIGFTLISTRACERGSLIRVDKQTKIELNGECQLTSSVCLILKDSVKNGTGFIRTFNGKGSTTEAYREEFNLCSEETDGMLAKMFRPNLHLFMCGSRKESSSRKIKECGETSHSIDMADFTELFPKPETLYLVQFYLDHGKEKYSCFELLFKQTIKSKGHSRHSKRSD